MATSSKYLGLKITKEILFAIFDAPKKFNELAMDKTGKKKYDAIKYLKEKEMIDIREVNGESIVTIKRKGKQVVIRRKLDELKIKKPNKWDGKWRIVSFDIPEKKRAARYCLKRKLDELGFATLQKSVYVHPYDCRDEIDLICSVYQVGPFVTMIIAQSFNGEEKAKRRFGLK